jgi:hypothetical protein
MYSAWNWLVEQLGHREWQRFKGYPQAWVRRISRSHNDAFMIRLKCPRYQILPFSSNPNEPFYHVSTGATIRFGDPYSFIGGQRDNLSVHMVKRPSDLTLLMLKYSNDHWFDNNELYEEYLKSKDRWRHCLED